MGLRIRSRLLNTQPRAIRAALTGCKAVPTGADGSFAWLCHVPCSTSRAVGVEPVQSRYG